MNNILDIIGNTPLVKIYRIYAKLEYLNPSGSIKDRMTSYIIKKAEELGELKPRSKIIEVTSGNTGISFAMISSVKKYEFIAIIPESVSIERRKIIKAFGAKIILTSKEKDMIGALKKYKQIIKNKKNIFLPKQFENPNNYLAYKETLGKEIIEQTKGKIDAFVAGIGSGGTIIGVAQKLKEFNPKIKIIGIEPAESAVINGNKPGIHKIQGIGEGFVPDIIKNNLNIIDKIMKVKSEDAIRTTRDLARKYGLLVGISSGANVFISKKIRKKYKNIITVLPDRGERYLSSGIFASKKKYLKDHIN